MTQLTPIELEDGSIIYIETQENIQVSSEIIAVPDSERELTRTELGRDAKGMREIIAGTPVSYQTIEDTIRVYTHFTLNALKKVAVAKINKVTLEFGVKVGGKAGIPYITEGTAESNLKITVECSFPDKAEDKS